MGLWHNYTQFRLYEVFPAILTIFFLIYGLFAYMDNFSRDKRGPYIRNRVYFITDLALNLAT